MRRQRASVLLIALAALSVSWLTTQSDLGKRLELGIADAGYRLLQHAVDSDIVIIGIDARSLAELEEWPWPRRHHARLIEQIAPASPKQVFIDIDFSLRSNAEDDVELERALSGWAETLGQTIVLPAFVQQVSMTDEELLVTRPLPAFARHAVLASVNLVPGIDGLVREVAVSTTANNDTLPTVAALLADEYPITETIPIDFSIDPSSFAYLSYADVVSNRVAAQHFADKTIFIGATAIELGDTLPVPAYQSLPGVVVQALALQSVREGQHTSLPQAIEWLLLAGWTLLLSFLFHRLTWRANAATLAGVLLLAGGSALFAFAVLDTIVAVLPFALAAATSYLLATLWSLESETLRAIAYAVGFRKRDALLKSIVLSTSDCIVCIDGSGIIRTANPAAASFLAPLSGRLAGRHIRAFVPSLVNDPGSEGEKDFDDLSNNKIFESVAQPEHGDSIPVELSISRVHLNNEQLYTAIIRDVSERKAQQKQLQFQATHDPLTTLPNRPAMAAYLDSAFVRRDGEQPFALMMIDLNRFKEVNDTLGHNIGDYVLHEVARRLAEVSRNHGFIARIGGDEFALVVDRFSDRTEVSKIAEDLIGCLKSPIETCGIAIDIGVSIGIALFPKDARDAETLFKQSDVAMYVAKRSGSGFEYYEAENDQNSVRRLTIATRLRQAISDNRLRLHYQPQINLETGKVDSAEALLRWHDAELGTVRPDEFIVLAEATDLIQPLTDWTLQEALQQAVRWRELGLELRLAINISSRILQSTNFPGRLEDLMAQSGVAPDAIELEITESAMMVDPKRALGVVNELSKLGVLISIDDYGTGFSSLAYLRDLPVHALKLDKSFVMNMQARDDDRVIVESTVQMAHALQLKVVAEGVETAADASRLREYGYDYAQGFLYSAALEPGAFFDWVRHFNGQAESEATGRLRSL